MAVGGRADLCIPSAGPGSPGDKTHFSSGWRDLNARAGARPVHWRPPSCAADRSPASAPGRALCPPLTTGCGRFGQRPRDGPASVRSLPSLVPPAGPVLSPDSGPTALRPAVSAWPLPLAWALQSRVQLFCCFWPPSSPFAVTAVGIAWPFGRGGPSPHLLSGTLVSLRPGSDSASPRAPWLWTRPASLAAPSPAEFLGADILAAGVQGRPPAASGQAAGPLLWALGAQQRVVTAEAGQSVRRPCRGF